MQSLILTAAGPTLTATTSPATSPTALSGFNYVAGTGPSAAQSFSLSGSNLTAGTITIAGSTNYEVSTDNASFGATASLTNAAGTLASTPVYVRLKSGLAAGAYNGETVVVTGGGTSTATNVAVSGSVIAATSPTLTTTSPATAITRTSATLAGSISSFGAPAGSSPAYGFVYSPNAANATPTLGGGGTTTLTTGTAATTGTYSSSATGLTANTLYTFQAYATNGNGTSYGGTVNFTTLANVSSTTDATPGQTTAAPGGTVGVDGAASITDRGVYYSTTSGFTPASGTKVAATTPTGTGSFTSALTGLTPGTTYYVVAYATNAGGTSYGTQVSFTTGALPTVSTTSASATGQTTATATGNVSSEGTASVTDRGVYYSTTSGFTPTSGTKVAATTLAGPGTFTSSLTGLAPLTTYYVVAYATSTVGTSYGTQVSFTTNGSATLTVNPATLNLGTTAPNTSGAISTYTLSGTGLTAGVTITPPAGVEVSTDGFLTAANSSATSLTVSQAAATAGVTVSVRLAAGPATTITNQNITNATAGALTQNVAVSGTVAASTSVCLSDGFESATFPPTNWIRSGTTDVTRSTTAGDIKNGSAAAIFGANTGTFTTPVLTNPSSLTFYLGVSSNTSAKQLQVNVSTTSQTSGFTTIQTFSHNTTGGIVLTSGSYDQYTIDLSAYSSFPAVWVQFAKVNSTTTSPFRLDDVAVSCGASSALTVATGTISPAGPYCVGQSPAGDVAVSVPYTVSNGSFAAGNVFTAYLSNDGFVNNKLAIGTLSATTSGTINAIIKQVSGLTTATNYRIRVEGSTATALLTDNGTNLAVASYLDNDVAAATTASGNAQATLTFTAPATCATNVVVTIKVGSAFGGKPAAGGTYTPGAGAGTVAFGTGTDLGNGQYVVYNGPASGAITVTGLTNGTRYAFGVFTTNGGATGTTGYNNGNLRTVVPVAPATLTELIVPQYISGRATTGTTHTTRLPYAWRVTLASLQPSTTYKYYTAVRAAADAASYSGAGISVETQTAGSFARKSPTLSSASSSFTTDASGAYTGWFGLEPSEDTRFIDQSVVYPMVVLNAGDGGNVATQFLATTSPVTALQLNTTATGATGVRGNSFGTASNLVLAYDNVGGTGRPLAATWLESDGSVNTTANGYVTFYGSGTTGVNGVDGAYGLLTPNANASGIQRIEQRALATGSLVGCVATSATGTWPSGTNTASPSGGTVALALTSGDVPFAAPTLTALSSTTVQPGQTLTLTGTGFSLTPNAQVIFAPGGTVAAATVNAAGTSLTVVVPSGAGNGMVAVRNSCGTSSPLATTAPPPSAPGILLVEDDFDYAAGGLLANNGWTGGGTTATEAGNETATNYPKGATLGGLPAGVSSRARILGENTSNDIIYRQFGTPPAGATTLYAASVVTFSSVENTTGANYIFAFRTSGTVSYRGQVQITRSATSASAFTAALRASGSFVVAPTEFAVGTPYVMVLKLENSAATSNTDVYSLYLLPATADLSQEPASPTLTVSGGSFFNTVSSFCIRQGQSNNPNAYLDGLRVATGWGAAVGNPVYTAANATIGAGNYSSLTLNNNSTLTTVGAVNVENQLALTTGTVNTNGTNSLTLYPAVAVAAPTTSSPGYVNGPVLRPVPAGASNTSFVFPVGRSGNYRPLTLNVASQSGLATYTATQTEGNAGQIMSGNNGLGTAPLRRVSTQRYYSITTDNVGSGFSGTITVPFAPNDYVNNPADAGLVVAKRDVVAPDPSDNNKWTNLGHIAETGTGTGPGGAPVSGSITSATFTGFSDFTLGATNDISNSTIFDVVNPLPVQLTSFAATRTSSGVQVAWATASERNSRYFDVERSLDGYTFAHVTQVAAQGTTSQRHAYASLDAAAPAALLYYRLRQVDIDGTVAYSPVVSVAAADGATAEFALAPNPAREHVRFLTAVPTAYSVRNALGQLVRSGTTTAGTNELLVSELPAGVYFFELHGDTGRVVRKFVKE